MGLAHGTGMKFGEMNLGVVPKHDAWDWHICGSIGPRKPSPIDRQIWQSHGVLYV